MSLKVELKPGERFILGQSVLTNGDHRTTLLVEGGEPILREKDILRAEDANTPASRIYFAIQLMYFATDPRVHHGIYFRLVGEFTAAAPSSRPLIERINNLILTDAYYKALKEAKRLIAYEKELLAHA
jgi:flagellar protein FlbT